MTLGTLANTEDIQAFEKKYHNIDIPVDSFLHECDEKRRETGVPQNQGRWKFRKFTEQEFPDFAKFHSGALFMRGVPKLGGYRGIITVSHSSKKTKLGKARHYSNPLHDEIIESINHLQHIGNTDYTLTPGMLRNIEIILEDNGHSATFMVPPESPIDKGAIENAIREVALILAKDKPAVTARIFNEAVARQGFNDHVKRDEVLKLVEEMLKN